MAEKTEYQKNQNLILELRTGAANQAYQNRSFYAGLKHGVRTLSEKKFYCIQNDGESDTRFDKRMNMTEHYDVVGRAVDIYSSIPFEKNPIVKSNDAYIKSLYDDFDVRGQSLSEVGQELLDVALWDGMASVFADLPANVGRGKEANPYCYVIDNDNIYGVDFNFAGELIHLRFITTSNIQDPDNRFNRICVKTAWIFDKIDGEVFFEAFTQDSEFDFVQTITPQKYVLDYIPLKTLYLKPIKTKNLMNPRSTVEALAHKNIEHLRSNTEQRNILHTVRIPILFGKGFRNDSENAPVVISSEGVWIVEGDEGMTVDLKYVEPQTGKALEAGRQDILDILQQMEVLGLSVLNKKSNITATATNVDDRQNTSIMASYAKRLEGFLNDVVDMMLDLKNASKGTKNATKPEYRIEIDTEYSDVYDQARMQFMQYLSSAGLISGDAMIEFAKKIGVMDVTASFEDEQEKIMDIGLKGIEIDTTANPTE